MNFEDAPLTAIEGKQFLDETIDLDGKWFVRCRLERCEMIFRGERPFAFTNCHLDAPRVRIEGRARMVLAQLAGLLDDNSLVALAQMTLDDTRAPNRSN